MEQSEYKLVFERELLMSDSLFVSEVKFLKFHLFFLESTWVIFIIQGMYLFHLSLKWSVILFLYCSNNV